MNNLRRNKVNEPSPEKWGGSWTNQKLDTFIKYVIAYLKIMNQAKNKYNWKTIYFDGFAGLGKREINLNTGDINIFPKTKEYEIFQGSVRRVLELENPYIFDYYYFIDNNKNYINQLEKDIQKYTLTRKIVLRRDDCNNQLIKLSAALKKLVPKHAALIFLDPFGMQVNWESISTLKNTKSDIWLLVPVGVAVNRLLTRSGKLKNEPKLEKFFGLSIKEIKEIFYRENTSHTLFGKETNVHKIEGSIAKIIEIYITQLKSIWKYVTEEPLVLLNRKNCPIFHFIFASNNYNAIKIASQIIDRKNL